MGLLAPECSDQVAKDLAVPVPTSRVRDFVEDALALPPSSDEASTIAMRVFAVLTSTLDRFGRAAAHDLAEWATEIVIYEGQDRLAESLIAHACNGVAQRATEGPDVDGILQMHEALSTRYRDIAQRVNALEEAFERDPNAKCVGQSWDSWRDAVLVTCHANIVMQEWRRRYLQRPFSECMHVLEVLRMQLESSGQFPLERADFECFASIRSLLWRYGE